MRSGSSGNLPAESTSFVGRRRESADVTRLLAASRLVTLTGPGGVGKTRLALRVASGRRRAFRDGVWLVDLASLGRGELVPEAVADALGLSDLSADPAAVLAGFLEDKQLLLVLDNSEHLVEQSGILVFSLLAAAPGLRVLVTSREALRIEGEHVVQVPPLPTEDGDDDGFEFSDAVELFVDRAQAVSPGFDPTPERRRIVHEICRRVDGIPLAIELIAVMTRILTLEEILSRVDAGLALYAGGFRAGSSRQRTLESAIDWSYRLCTPAEQLLWKRLSVFPGSFDLDAVEKICVGDAIEAGQSFDLVVGLVDKSILTRAENAYGHEARFRMLAPIRQFGENKLAESGGEIEVVIRHRDYYRELVEAAQRRYFTPGELDWTVRLLCDHANIRAVLDRCLTRLGQPELALDMCARMSFYWTVCALIREGYLWLCRGLAAAPEASITRARALVVGAYLGLIQGDYEHGTAMLREAGDLAAGYGDQELSAGVTCDGALAALSEDDVEAAFTLLRRAFAEYEEAGSASGMYRASYLSAFCALALDRADGQCYVDTALALADGSGSRWSRRQAMWVSGLCRLRDGKTAEAEELLREALEDFRPVGDYNNLERCVLGLAWCATAEGRYRRSAKLLGIARSLSRIGGATLSSRQVKRLFDGEYERRCRENLGATEFDAVVGQGASMPLDKAIDLALGRQRTTPSRNDVRPAGRPGSRLSRRESEVAQLVGEGLSNKAIAARLVISSRTAETHIEHILSKLGFRSRAQIATWITAQGTQGPRGDN